MIKLRIIKYLVVSILLSSLTFAQSPSGDEEVLIVAGKEYNTGSLHNLFFGNHWRDVWATPVKVKVLDVNKYAGGLIPIKKGGGFQTKSLRFKGNDNHYWKFRSIEKDPSKTLPESLRKSIAADILQDQISTANPYAALVVAPILDSLGILQAKPFLCFLPDVEELGEFREEFGGTVGIMEIHPDVDEDDEIVFLDADKIKSTLDLFERLEKNEDEYVNSKEYLKARLVDLFLGDWDRHADQWKWARYNDGEKKVWLPIPRDRDQAFAKFDGLLPSIAEYLVPAFNTFSNSFGNIEDLTWNGRFVDQHFLIQVTKNEWDSVTTFVKRKLTDKLIISAANEFPPEVHTISVNEIVEKLKSRRDKLEEISEDYYNFINTVVDIYGSKDNDFVQIDRIDNDRTSLKLFKDTKKKPNLTDSPYFQKIFDNNLTKEIRLYLIDGDDVVKLEGSVDDGILVRIIGGEGKDEIIDNSKVDGYFLSVTPIPDAEEKTKIYDSGKKTRITFGSGTTYDNDKVILPTNLEEKYRPLQRDRSSETFFFPIINFSSDDGFVIGGGTYINQYGFRSIPYKNKYFVTAQYATEPQNGAIVFESTFNSLIKNVSVNFDVGANGLLFTKYYGYGNETGFSEKLEAENYYRLEQTLVSVNPSFELSLYRNTNLRLGLEYFYSDSKLGNESLLEAFPEGNYGLGKFSSSKTNIILTHDSRDNIAFAQSGFYLEGSIYYSPKLLDNREDFGGTTLDLRTYLTSSFVTKTTFAFRVLGQKVWGKYPFLSAAFLGGSDNLLGFRRERFSGDASLYGTMQMRMQLTKIKLLIDGDFGLHGFAETGRVFTATDNSNIWHPSFGGGLWISYLDRSFNIVTTLAKSEETLLIYFGFGFNF